jgi:hypothetical protein
MTNEMRSTILPLSDFITGINRHGQFANGIPKSKKVDHDKYSASFLNAYSLYLSSSDTKFLYVLEYNTQIVSLLVLNFRIVNYEYML